MAKDFQLIHITVDEERLKEANNRLRNQFVGCMHAHNELTMLNRLITGGVLTVNLSIGAQN
jgi:hypothetical protein